jgi:hypothetical protein
VAGKVVTGCKFKPNTKGNGGTVERKRTACKFKPKTKVNKDKKPKTQKVKNKIK